MYLEKLEEFFDIEKLRNEVTDILSKHELVGEQIALNYRAGFEEQCWTDGCGSPFIKTNENINPMENRKKDPVPRFKDTDFQYINPTLENTEINKIYDCYKKKFVLGRFRIAVLKPKICYGWHYDFEKRIHIPIFTNPGAFIITEDNKATHLPATGEAWLFNANNGYHTAVNSSYTENRIHLLLNVW